MKYIYNREHNHTTISYNEQENVWDIVEKKVSLQKIITTRNRGKKHGRIYYWLSGLHWVCEGICGFMELDSFDKKSMGICYLGGMDGCS